MKYEDIFEAEGDGSQDDATLYSLGNEFFESAKLLASTSCVQVNHTVVTYYLFCHSAELFIKSLLYKKGLSIAELKKLGHNLEILISKYQEYCATHSLEQLSKVAKLYSEKYFEYRKYKSAEFAQLDLLELEIKALKNHVSFVVFDL